MFFGNMHNVQAFILNTRSTLSVTTRAHYLQNGEHTYHYVSNCIEYLYKIRLTQFV